MRIMADERGGTVFATDERSAVFFPPSSAVLDLK